MHILCNEEDIPKSPYMAEIQPAPQPPTVFDPSKVVATGPGLEKTGVTVNKWAEFTVDTRMAGPAPLHISAIDADYNPVDVLVRDNKDGTYWCRYMPKKNSKHTIIVSYGGVNVPNSPFRVGAITGGYIVVLPWLFVYRFKYRNPAIRPRFAFTDLLLRSRSRRLSRLI